MALAPLDALCPTPRARRKKQWRSNTDLLQKTIAQFNIEHSNQIDQTIAISNSRDI
jgi:hypothetical protein